MAENIIIGYQPHEPNCKKSTTSTQDIGGYAYIVCEDCGALLDRIGPEGTLAESLDI